MTNDDIAAALDEVANLLQIDGAQPFRIRSYQRAAETVRGLGRSVLEVYAAGGRARGRRGLDDHGSGGT